MALIDTLKARYFVEAGDTTLPSEPLPSTTGNARITPLIHGTEYFADLTTTLAGIGTGATPADNAGHFIFIAGWWLDLVGTEVNPAPGSLGSAGVELGPGKPFALDGAAGTQKLLDLLVQKAAKGVDVRILGWVSWAVMSSAVAQSGAASVRDVNLATLESIFELRKQNVKCCLNILSHTAGAAHLKYVVGGTPAAATGYTGGIDLRFDRHRALWHDVQTKIEGAAAVQVMYDYFRALWNETRSRPVKSFRTDTDTVASTVAANDDIPSRTLASSVSGTHHVELLRTIPRFNYSFFNCLPEGEPVTLDPENTGNGIFEVRTAWRKAILAAEQYIYMEDQSYWSVEVMSWINEAIKKQADLRVILLTSGIADPNDPVLPPFQRVAFHAGLLKGLSTAQRNQIVCVKRGGTFVHAKTTLIDDHWAIIGSANCMRRSLYTDLEHSVAVLDENDALVRDYRTRLWGKSFGLAAADFAKLNNIDQALNVWKSTWGTPGSGVTLPASFGVVPLPPPPFQLDDEQQEKYDWYMDVDSREAWGGVFPA